MKLSGAIDHYLDAQALSMPRAKKAWTGEVTKPPAVAADAWPKRYPAPGCIAANKRMHTFIDTGLHGYNLARNDLNADGTSGLSTYLRYGQVSPIALARAARAMDCPQEDRAAFLEQLVIRRELCRNYAWYAGELAVHWEGLPDWSRINLNEHASDARSYRYSYDDFLAARTHYPYWNAAQHQLLASGTIHNYMRMYWGKMILAWSQDPHTAFDTAMHLNDSCALDGRDPNGWAGVAWCFGLHDRPWPSRAVFGTVRAMGAAGLKRKFDVDTYTKSWNPPL
ncbi:MAG TPA: hypothetical protein PLC54_06495, partial [Spirochaetales bacterium]|nr:hypothetical protein [Spirochaetales bacterium]